ncbi:MAG: hypothetical protein ACFE89_08520 [Candidatus Hodarchaeota archaeon]
MPTPPILVAAVAVIVDKSKMLVWETPDRFLELPGFIVARTEKAIRSLTETIRKLELSSVPQQTLYLRQVSLFGARRKSVLALVRVIHVKSEKTPSFQKGRYEAFSKLQENQRASPLTRLIAQWMTRIYSF